MVVSYPLQAGRPRYSFNSWHKKALTDVILLGLCTCIASYQVARKLIRYIITASAPYMAAVMLLSLFVLAVVAFMLLLLVG